MFSPFETPIEEELKEHEIEEEHLEVILNSEKESKKNLAIIEENTQEQTATANNSVIDTQEMHKNVRKEMLQNLSNLVVEEKD